MFKWIRDWFSRREARQVGRAIAQHATDAQLQELMVQLFPEDH